MANKKVRTYAEAVEELRRCAQQAEEEGDWDRANLMRHHAAKIEEWLSVGRTSPCPVDLAGEGILVEEAEQAEASLEGEAFIEPAPPPEIGEIAAPAEPPSEAAVGPAEPTREVPEEVREEVPAPAEEEIGHPSEGVALRSRSARRLLDEVYQRRAAGDLNAALSLCRTLLASLPREAPEYCPIFSLYNDIQRERDRELEEALEAGKRAYQEGNLEESRTHYSKALQLDPDNDIAHRALLEIDGKFDDQRSEANRRELIRGLKEQRDIKRLGDSVYYAEALVAEGKADAEILALLPEARKRYDEMRIAMGQTTTLMRTGSLEERLRAVEDIRQRIIKGEPYIHDATLNRVVSLDETLREAEESVFLASEDLTQYKIELAQESLPEHPEVAKQHIEPLLSEPLHDEHRRRLERMLAQEIEPLLDAKRRANDLVERAMQQTSDPLEAFKLLLEAQRVFPHVEGRQEQVERARATAQRALKAKIESLYSESKNLLEQADKQEKELAEASYRGAHERLAEADGLYAVWPEAELPAELIALQEEGRALKEEVKHSERQRNDFERQVNKIRKWAVNPSRRQAALDLFERLRDPIYARFDSLRTDLEVELLNLRGIEEQIRQLDNAVSEEKWDLALSMGEQIMRSGKAGDLSAHVEAQMKRARAHLLVEEARRHLNEQNIPEAKRCLDSACSMVPELKEQLGEEYAQIEEAQQNTKPMRKILQEAENSWQRATYQEKLELLRKARHVAGLEDHSETLGLPRFQISLVTYEAKQRVYQWEEELREKLLKPILEYGGVA